jgi:ATP-binding cassette subfamily F protein uup
VLEESLTEFTGALVLVTHDRYLLDRVSTAVLGLDGQGGAQIYADYWQWEAGQSAKAAPAQKAAAATQAARSAPVKKKLSYLEAREWEQMEARILEAERSLEQIHAEMQSQEVVSDGPRLQSCVQRLHVAERSVEELYARWAELEAKQQ